MNAMTVGDRRPSLILDCAVLKASTVCEMGSGSKGDTGTAGEPSGGVDGPPGGRALTTIVENRTTSTDEETPITSEIVLTNVMSSIRSTTLALLSRAGLLMRIVTSA